MMGMNLCGKTISSAILWGSGEVYSRNINTVKEYCDNHNITIIGITTKDEYYETMDGFVVFSRDRLEESDFDIVIVMVSMKKFREICSEALGIGIDVSIMIPAQVFSCIGFSIEKYIMLRDSNISIFSNNCWGGYTYHYFGMEFLSPTINLSIGPEQKNIDMLASLREYMEDELVYSSTEINPVNNRAYPVAYIGDGVRVNLLHYSSFDEGNYAWMKRKKRVNYNNILFMMYTENEKYAELFERLDVRKKVCFVPFETDLPSAVTVYPYMYRKDKSEPFWQYVNAMASGRIALYDAWELLLNGNVVYRITHS